MCLDKERYEKELRSLESYSEKLKKPKKCLSAYMIFVKEVNLYQHNNFLDKTVNCRSSPWNGSSTSNARSGKEMVIDDERRKKIFQRQGRSR